MKLTYGTELEIPDWDTNDTPKIEALGAKRNKVEQDICNSSGVSNDPSLKTCRFGGEINTKPTDSIESQVQHIMDIYKSINYKLNYSVGMHLHIRIPGLRESLEQLNKWSQWLIENQKNFRSRVIEPIVESDNEGNYFFEAPELKLFRERYNYRKRNRYRTFKSFTYETQMASKSPREWYLAFFKKNEKGIIWHTGYRPFINLTQLFNGEVDTIEFRGFNMTDNPEELLECFKICQSVVDCVYDNVPFEEVSFDINKVPKTLPFDAKLERIYKLTNINHNKPKAFKLRVQSLKELLNNGEITAEDLGIPLSNLGL